MSQFCILVPGMPLVGRRTLLGVTNAVVYTLKGIDDETLHIEEIEGEDPIEIPVSKFHEVLFPGFCMTFSGSQGKTIRQDLTLWQLGWSTVTRGGVLVKTEREDLYVGTSRAQGLDRLQAGAADRPNQLGDMDLSF